MTGNLSSSSSEIGLESISRHCSNSCEHEAKLLELVQDFWRAEEIVKEKKSYSPDEQVCEDFYQKTTRQDKTGQYIVSLPWKSRDQLSSAHLDNSYSAALRALTRLEANFAKDEKLKLVYTEFMQEYIDLGHMSLSSNSDSSSFKSQAFLSHHGVWKETNTTTKLRTVFNGSSKTKSGVSVIDLLHVGPNLLQNPVALICAWRRYRIALYQLTWRKCSDKLVSNNVISPFSRFYGVLTRVNPFKFISINHSDVWFGLFAFSSYTDSSETSRRLWPNFPNRSSIRTRSLTLFDQKCILIMCFLVHTRYRKLYSSKMS